MSARALRFPEDADDPAGLDEVAAGRRMCALSRTAKTRDELIRFVKAPDGQLTPDLACKLPGRGVWVDGTRRSIELAIKKKVFARGLKTEVNLPEALPDRLESLLERAALQALSMANKAGQAVCGFDKTSAVIDRAEAVAVLHAADGAEGGCRKLDGKFRAICAELGRPAIIIDHLTIDQMSLAMGRSNVVHAALLHGGAADSAVRLAHRLARFRRSADEAGREKA